MGFEGEMCGWSLVIGSRGRWESERFMNEHRVVLVVRWQSPLSISATRFLERHFHKAPAPHSSFKRAGPSSLLSHRFPQPLGKQALSK